MAVAWRVRCAVWVWVGVVCMAAAGGQSPPPPSLPVACSSRGSCQSCTTHHGPSDPVCLWCGSYASGKCLGGGASTCRDEETRGGGTCPPSPYLVVLPVLVAYSLLTVVVLVQHLYEVRYVRQPANADGPLHSYEHLHAADSALVREYADAEGVEYADYEQRRDSQQRFLFLLTSVSLAVVLTVIFQERMGTPALLFSIAWLAFCVYLLVVKTWRKSRVYILTESRALVVAPKWFSVWGRTSKVYLPAEMPFVSVRSYKDGLGSVFFTHEDDYLRDDFGADEHMLGFENVARAEEVYRLVALWRAAIRGDPPPTAANRSPEPKPTMAERVQTIVTAVIFLFFFVVFAVIFVSGNENGSFLWYVWVLVPYALIWAACLVVWARSKYLLRKRRQAGFMVLDTAFGNDSVPLASVTPSPYTRTGRRSTSSASDSDSDSTSLTSSDSLLPNPASLPPAAGGDQPRVPGAPV